MSALVEAQHRNLREIDPPSSQTRAATVNASGRTNSCSGLRTVSTGHGASRTTRSATLPIRAWASAQLTGIVILEATVGTDGCVESVRVLRSRHPFLDRASIDALKEWQYSPLTLNGIATPFVVTVTFNFSVRSR